MTTEILIIDDNADIRNIFAASLVLYPASLINSSRMFLMSALSSIINISVAMIYFGIMIWTLAPLFVFKNLIDPLWSLIILSTIDNPKPVPFSLVV